MVEGASLLRRYTSNRIEGSNHDGRGLYFFISDKGISFRYQRDGICHEMGCGPYLKLVLANKGYVGGYIGLSNMYYFGNGVKINYEEAFKWAKLAAKKGIPSSEFRMAYHYLSGLGITKDTSEGYRWASLSAKQGYAPAENLLGDHI